MLELRNPHSVLAALEQRPHDVREVRLGSQRPGPEWQRVADLAREAAVSVVQSTRDDRQRSRRSGTETGRRTAGSTARVRPRNETPLEELLSGVSPDAAGQTWLALDCLQDPHNVGAVLRVAAFFGVRGVITTRNKSAPLNAVVYDTASGALEYLPLCVVSNLSQAMTKARDAGLWMLGSSERADTDIFEIPRDRPWLLIVGNEHQGLRRLTLDKCDQVCRLTPAGRIASLNVSVATGALLTALQRPGA